MIEMVHQFNTSKTTFFYIMPGTHLCFSVKMSNKLGLLAIYNYNIAIYNFENLLLNNKLIKKKNVRTNIF